MYPYPHNNELTHWIGGDELLLVAHGPGIKRRLRRLAARERAAGSTVKEIIAVSRAGEPCASVSVRYPSYLRRDGFPKPLFSLGLTPDRYRYRGRDWKPRRPSRQRRKARRARERALAAFILQLSQMPPLF